MQSQLIDLHAPVTISAYTVRAMTLDDLPAWHALLTHYLTLTYGGSTLTKEELRSDWTSPGFDVPTASRGAFTSDGTLVAVAELWDNSEMPVRPWFEITVDDAHRDPALLDHLIIWGEARARQAAERIPADARLTLQTGVLTDKAWHKTLLEKHGMTTNRRGLTMRIDFDGQPPAPQFPDGIRLYSMADGLPVRELIRIQRETFRDHRGFVDEPLDKSVARWENYINASHAFEPSLMLLALDGAGDDAKPAGVIICSMESDEDADKAWVNVLGVMPDYRRKGLGMALLLYAFNEFYKRGKPRAGLGVDGSSLTNATKLYERAGMRVEHAYDHYEKVLRDGVEYSKQS